MVLLPYEMEREELRINTMIKTITPKNVTVTTYTPSIEECDSTPLITASGFKINPKRIKQHGIIAVSRDLYNRGFKFGTKVKLTGCGEYDGIYVVEDVMNKRYRNTIDILIGENDKQTKIKNAKMYKI